MGGAVLAGVSFLVFPGWLGAWRDVLTHRGDSEPMLLRTGGFLIAAAALRWRRRESWVLLTLGAIPLTPSLYDLIPLFLVAQGLRETCVLAIGGNLAFLLLLSGIGIQQDVGSRVMLWSLLCLYLPATIMILRRPNVPDETQAPAPRATVVDVALLAALILSAFFAGWGTLARYV
jgi:hypothetical protein